MTNPCKSARKKPNRFEELGEAVEEHKDSDIIDPTSSLTGESKPSAKDNHDLKTSFLEFQNRTNTQFAAMEFNFHNMSDTLKSITETLGQIHSRQNSTSPHHSAPDEQNDSPSDTQTIATNDHDDDEDEDNQSTNSYSNGNYISSTFPTQTTPPGINNYSNVPTTQTPHKFWKIVRDENLEPHRFQSLVRDITLQDDSLHALRHFYNRIRHAMHTCFKKHIDILPTFGNLKNITNITNLLVPINTNYPGYAIIKSVYHWFGDSIGNVLYDPKVINSKTTPQAHQVILTNSNIDDGWKLLFTLLHKRCPFLGGTSMDVATEITLLRLKEKETIHSLYKRVQDIQTKLLYSRENIDYTRLLKFYLKAMAISKEHFPLIQIFIADLNNHITTFGANTPHPIHTCTSVYEYLISIEAPERFDVSQQNAYKTKHQNNFRYNQAHQHAKHRHRPNISVMEQVQDIIAVDDSSLFNNEATPTVNSDSDDYKEYTFDDDSNYEPIIAAFRSSSKIICDACGARGHHASKCFKRGTAFLPRDVQRRIAAYNAKFGDTPTIDKSPDSHKSYHALPTPDHRTPPTSVQQQTETNKLPTPASQTPTISRLDHVLPTGDIEDILDTALGTDDTPVINALQATPSSDTQQIKNAPTLHKDYYAPHTLSVIHQILDSEHKASIQSIKSRMSSSHNPFIQPIINDNGTVAIHNLNDFQRTILNTYPHTFFKQY